MSVSSVTFTVTDPETLEVIHQHQVDVDKGHGPLADAIAIYGARQYRNGYFAGQGWTLDSEMWVHGGTRGDASVGMGDMVDWSIMGDK